MNKGYLPGLSPLWLIMLAMVLGTLIVVLLPVAIATGEPIKSSDWIGFAGNVVSGAVTLLAAIVAWFAVQRQITASKEIANLTQTEAWETIRDDLRDMVDGIDIFWRSVDHAMASTKTEELQEWRYDHIAEYFHDLPDPLQIERIEQAALTVGPKKSRRLAVLVFTLKELRRKADWFVRGPQNGQNPLKWRSGRVAGLQLMLTIFDRELAVLDAELAVPFSARKRTELDTLTRRQRLEQTWSETLDAEDWLERKHLRMRQQEADDL